MKKKTPTDIGCKDPKYALLNMIASCLCPFAVWGWKCSQDIISYYLMIKSGVIVQKGGKSKQLYSLIHSTPRFKVLYSVKTRHLITLITILEACHQRSVGGKCNAFVQSFLGRVLLSACSNSSATSRQHWFLPVLLTAVWPHWSGSLCLITAPQFNPDWGEGAGSQPSRGLTSFRKLGRRLIDWRLRRPGGSLVFWASQLDLSISPSLSLCWLVC